MKKELLVYKIGTAGITNKQGLIDIKVLQEIVRQLALLHKNYNILIVSSGAVGTGKKFIKDYSGKITAQLVSDKLNSSFSVFNISLNKKSFILSQ